MTVSMKPDLQSLEEVVVIAYGQQKKVTITGSVSQVGGDELLKAPVASVANALQGKLPGMSVVQPSGMVVPGKCNLNTLILDVTTIDIRSICTKY